MPARDTDLTHTAAEGPAMVRASGELLAEALGLVPDAAVVVDPAGSIVAANDLAEQCFGFAPGSMCGRPVEDLVPSRLRQRHVEHRQEFAEGPRRRPMGMGLGLWAQRPDGTEFPVDVSLTPLEVGGRRLTLAAVRDLSERRADWDSQARLASIVASSDNAILSTDLAGTVSTWNPAAERLLGHGAAQIVGRSYWRLVPPELRVPMEQRMALARDGVRVETHDTRRVRADGTLVDVAESLALVTDSAGQPVGFSAVLYEITSRKRAETELRMALTESQRRLRWITAMSEVRLALLSGMAMEQWLEFITRRVRDLIDADGVLVVLPSESDRERLEVAATFGARLLKVGQTFPIAKSLTGRVFRSGQSVVSTDLLADSPAPTERFVGVPIGPLVAAPLTSSGGPTGVLIVTRVSGRAPFEAEDIRLVESFAQHAGLGMELAHAQLERAQYVLVADRERIARDLHDHVIQRLFAVGMSLQAAANSLAGSPVLERIEESVDELDATIRDVRSTIFSLELQAAHHPDTGARSRILEVATMAAPALGFQPRLHFDGPIDTRVPEEIVPDVLAVIRETLSNTARHALARSAQVRVVIDGDQLMVEVVDDGRGAAGRTRSSGLANLKARAEARGGTMDIGVGRDARGTRVLWAVPLAG